MEKKKWVVIPLLTVLLVAIGVQFLHSSNNSEPEDSRIPYTITLRSTLHDSEKPDDFNTDAPTSIVHFEDVYHGVAFDVPYNKLWGDAKYRIEPYETLKREGTEDISAVYFGQLVDDRLFSMQYTDKHSSINWSTAGHDAETLNIDATHTARHFFVTDSASSVLPEPKTREYWLVSYSPNNNILFSTELDENQIYHQREIMNNVLASLIIK